MPLFSFSKNPLIHFLTWYISGKKKRDTGYGYHEQEECGTIEDCFDQPCPRFGIVVRATFTRRTPSYGSGYGLTERQTSESFNYEQEECGTIEDCFDQPCPRFGIVVKATFKRPIPSYGNDGYGLRERQSGEILTGG